jgi:hypothetical protein
MHAHDDVTVQRSQRHVPRRTSLRPRSMPLTGRPLVRGALVAVLFLCAAPPGHAQRGPVASGSGAFVAPNQQDHLFGFSVFEVPGGSVRGHCAVLEPASSGVVAFDVTSAVQVGNALLMAGPITLDVQRSAAVRRRGHGVPRRRGQWRRILDAGWDHGNQRRPFVPGEPDGTGNPGADRSSPAPGLLSAIRRRNPDLLMR